jgi:hypothetical protein
MLRNLALAFSIALFSACLDTEGGDPGIAVDEAALSVPDPNPAHTQISSFGGDGACLDAPLAVPAGTQPQLQQFPCNAGNNQFWRFTQVNPGVFRISSSRHPGLCLDLADGIAAQHRRPQLFPCHTGDNQLWLVAPSGAGAEIKPIRNLTMCLDVENGVRHQQAFVQLFPCHGGGNQYWKFRTWINTPTLDACNGTRGFRHGSVAPGAVGSFPATPGEDVQCPDQWFHHDDLNCGTGTNWVVADRRGGSGEHPVACFRQ